MVVTATHIAYYHLCKYKLWLFCTGIKMEHTSEEVRMGKIIHQMSYPQRSKRYTEVYVEGCKIDFYNRHEKRIHEMKKSMKMEFVHIWQLKYYIWLLLKNGIKNVTGILEYPLLHKRRKIVLEKSEGTYLKKVVKKIERIAIAVRPPKLIRKKICKQCSYFDFCYVNH